jgi:acylphosphatase
MEPRAPQAASGRYQKPNRVNVCKHLVIRGRVQGVGFRFSMVRKARELGVTGWVRNLRSGDVEAMVEGSPEAVEAMIAWAHRGPPGAHVAAVDIREGEGSYADFDIRY